MLFSHGSTAPKEERDWYVVLEDRLFVDMLYRRYLATFNPSPSITHAYSTGTKTLTKPLRKESFLTANRYLPNTLPIDTGYWGKKTNKQTNKQACLWAGEEKISLTTYWHPKLNHFLLETSLHSLLLQRRRKRKKGAESLLTTNLPANRRL